MTDTSAAEATSRADTERLVTLSGGIYAIAMTLLVLDLRIPPHLTGAAFQEALRSSWPNLGAAALSFAVLAGFWRDQRRILAPLSTVSPLVTRLTLLGRAGRGTALPDDAARRVRITSADHRALRRHHRGRGGRACHGAAPHPASGT
ncbi:TMEM175 family protein [Streptomyces sp. NPDC048508]|uniref:TMEM175 family protein n=1 Tax=Streptomyces sp. NPDC048508 TaxID=3365561 RepID=UPI003724B53F